MKRDMMTARFKRDFVAYSAIAIFFLIIVSEVTMAIWIPMQMHNDTMFAERIKRIRAVRAFDSCRKTVRRIIEENHNRISTQEAQLMLQELDRIAIYLHTDDNSKNLSPEQIELISAQLADITSHYARLNKGTPMVKSIEINTSNAINKIAEEGL